MPCRINLRHDQSSKQIATSQVDGITIYAPDWIKQGLQVLGSRLNGIKFQVNENSRSREYSIGIIIDSFTITNNELSLVQLQKISRNEERNVSGVINILLYKDLEHDLPTIYALKDLVRQTIIIGLDETTHFGGYSCDRIQQQIPVYIVDLIGLQFQRPCNTGRLVLYTNSVDKYSGLLDNLIFENVVGEPRKTYEQVEAEASSGSSNATERYVKVGIGTGKCYFDTVAYKRFVATDLILCLLGLNQTLQDSGQMDQHIHFKFLKYGTGYFAGYFGQTTNQYIFDGVLDGIEEAFAKYGEIIQQRIRSFEFPFFKIQPGSNQEKRLIEIQSKYSIECKFSHDDALKMTAPKSYVIASTNCADPHAANGNEMGFGSVDSAIAENIKSKGNIFNPLLNSKIKEKYIQM